MMNNRLRYCFLSILFILILMVFNLAVIFSCSEPTERPYVFSVEILFNDENYTDFKAKINEQFDISVTVNNYRESYELKSFYAWIDYNDDKIELNYGINNVSFEIGGKYQVKVYTIDSYNHLMTKRMPFYIIDEPPQILGEISDYFGENADKTLYAFNGIGCILPDFEIIDDSGEEIIPEISADIGQVKIYSDIANDILFYYYINKNSDDDTKEDIITIKAQDSAGNKNEIMLNVIKKTTYNNWFFNKYNEKDIIILDDINNTLFFDGYENDVTETTCLGYNYHINESEKSAVIVFKKFDINSFFCLVLEANNFIKNKIEFQFSDQKIFINDVEFNSSEVVVNWNQENNTISISDLDKTSNVKIENIQNIVAIEFEMKNISFYAKID